MDPQLPRQALEARDLASALYLKNPRVTLIDIGWKMSLNPVTGKDEYTGELAVRIHVRSKPSEATIETLDLTNSALYIDKDLLERKFKTDIIQAAYPLHLGPWNPQPADPRSARFDPLQGGVSLSGQWIPGYGTLGGIVEDPATGDKMILSNWHVLAGSYWGVPGTPIYQPGYDSYDRQTVALLSRDAFNQGIDAAVARLTGARGWTNNQLDIGPVTGCMPPDLSMRVTKSGRVSHVTYGQIDGIEGEYPIRYSDGTVRTIKHACRIVPQRLGDTVSSPGDSGSWWLDQDTHQAIGLHFAGQDDPETALAISMPEVLAALKVNIAGLAPTQPAPQPAPQPEPAGVPA